MISDYLLAIRKMHDSAKKWRRMFLFGVLLILLLLFTVVGGDSNNKVAYFSSGKNIIAKVDLSGYIDDKFDVDKITQLVDNDSIKALLLKIDSGGGEVTVSEKLYKAVARFAAVKPVVVAIDNVAASGAYMVAVAGDRIFAHNTSVVGSIGVAYYSFNIEELAKRIGVGILAVKSSALKASPSLFESGNKESIDAINEHVMDIYNFFVDIVKKERFMSDDMLKYVIDGRIFSGRKAKECNLIDEIGDEKDALAWLEKEKNIKNYLVTDFPIVYSHNKIDYVSSLLGSFLGNILQHEL